MEEKFVKFIVEGDCDAVVLEAPEDITLKDLLKQMDKIKMQGSGRFCSAEKWGFESWKADLRITKDKIENISGNPYSCYVIEE